MILSGIWKHFRSDWFKYGFETLAIVVGILGAFALENWRENLNDRSKEEEYIQNLRSDLERQKVIIEEQIAFETDMRGRSEQLLQLIREPQLNFQEINSLALTVLRKTFMVDNPVFEDLKYSGNLSLIANAGQRNALLRFYQRASLTESVIAKNNAVFVDEFTLFLFRHNLVDFGVPIETLPVVNLDFSLDIDLLPGSQEIILANYRDPDLMLKLHNQLSIRGRTSTIHIDLLNILLEINQEVLDQFS